MTHSGRLPAFAHIDPSTRDPERDTAVKEKGKKEKNYSTESSHESIKFFHFFLLFQGQSSFKVGCYYRF